MEKIFEIYSPARIHIGFLDLNLNSNRKFGSLGLTISNFFFKIRIEKSQKIEVISNCISIKKKTIKVIEFFNLERNISNFKITILSSIPLHSGLGAGTQLTLSVGYLISQFFNLNMSVNQIAHIFNRGQRSGIGIESFKKGGFNIDVGKLKGSTSPPLNILNLNWPKDWKILLIMDQNITGVHGKKELKEFKELKKSKFINSNSNFKSLAMNIIPGIIEKNFKEFSNGLREIQDNMSKIFYGNKNKFASSIIEKIFLNLKKNGVNCFGQSSWGPTGFIFFENAKKRNELLKYLENYINLNEIRGIDFLKIDGRNFGKKMIKKERL